MKENKKVYCYDCIYYRFSETLEHCCDAPENLRRRDNWLGKYKQISTPNELNKNNDCKLYLSKYWADAFI